MPTRDIVVIGASAGGIEALLTLVRELPPEFPGSIFAVLHRAAAGPDVLPQLVQRRTDLPARVAVDGQPVAPRQVYFPPADHHLLLRNGYVRVTRGPRENGVRPAVDPLFRSAAASYGPRVIGVVLSGSLDDGTLGLQVIKQRGGLAIVQDPAEAMYPDMPTSAIAYVDVDHVAPAAEIGRILQRTVSTPPSPE